MICSIYFKAENFKYREGSHGVINQTKMELNFADWWGEGLARQIAYEVINLIQVNSSSKNYLNAENLNEVQSCCFDKKVLENWQSVIKIFNMNNLMYQNI